MHGLEDLLNDAQCVEKDATVNREKNNLAKEDNLKAVRDFRKDIDDYFDKLQRKVEQEIRQCHSKNEGLLTEQLKTCFEVKETALIKQKQINSIVQKNMKSTLSVTTENLRTEIATLKQTLYESSRQARCGMYEFQKNDVVQSLISTESVLGTLKDNHSGIEELTHTLPEPIELNEKSMQFPGLPEQPNRQKNKSGPSPCEMTKTIRTTEVQPNRAKNHCKQGRLNSGTNRKEMEENGAIVESRGLPCQPNMQKNKSGPSPCEMNESIRTTEVQLHKAEKPWKQRRQKSSTNTKEVKQNDAAIESRGLPSQPSRQNNKSGPSPCEMTKPIRTTEVQLQKAKPCKQGRLNSGTNKKEVGENDAATKPVKSRGRYIQPSQTNKSETPPCQTNQSIRTTEVELHKAKNPWKPRRLESADSEKEVEENDATIEDLCKKTQIIMNKLTPQKFQVLVSQMKALKIDTEDKLKGVVDLVFEKLKVKSDSKPGKMVIFRVVLLARCQREFKTKYRQIPVLPPNARNSLKCKDESRKEELTNGQAEAKQRSLGNMRFIGELFKLKMISRRIMHDCLFKLLRAKDPESLASVCRLLTIIGKELDTDKDKPRMDQYFQQMEKIANDKKSSTRVRFMLQDIISVRLNKWVPRCSDNNPKTIDQIHMEVAQERQVKALLSQEVKELEKAHKGDRGGRARSQIADGAVQGAGSWSMEGKQPQLASVDRSKDQTKISHKQNMDEAIKIVSDRTSMDRKTSSAPANRSEEDFSQIIPDTCPGSRERRGRGWFWTPLNLRTRIPQEHMKEGLVNTKRGGSTLTTPSTGLPMTEIADRLHDLIVVRREDNETLFDWIESNIDDADKANIQFIRELMTAVCQSSIKGEKGKEEVVPSDISRRRNLLQKYLGYKPMFELQALFALQVLVARLEYPQGLLKSLFDILYDEDIITEDAFIEWKRSEDEPDGKSTALEHVVQFFEWLT